MVANWLVKRLSNVIWLLSSDYLRYFFKHSHGDILGPRWWLGSVPNEPICAKAEVNFKKRTSVQSLSTHFPQL